MADKQPTILIADDEEDIKDVLSLYLEASGFEVITAFDGLDAMERAKEAVPDLILMDVMMPVIDGIEVTRQLKENDSTKNIPIILLSAAAQSEMVEKGLNSGAIDYISKPFEPEQVKNAIQQVLKIAD
jgi:CheY-like chemotaxis protein